MQIHLTNKVALVGGSTQGLGWAVAQQLAACGASVVLMARNKNKLQQCIQQLPTNGQQQHQFIVADFTNFASYKTVISSFFANNTIDILVNNTQGPTAGNVLTQTSTTYQDAFNLLFQTVTFTTQVALESMMNKGFGRIINISSITVKQPLQHLVLSNTMRSAIISWAKTIATEVAANNITVNNILTGYFNTERMQQLHKSIAQNKQTNIATVEAETLQQIPMQRFGQPEEYGYLVAFLASEYASYITGTNIPIDGGLIRGV